MPGFRSAGCTDAGRVRASNQDAFLQRPDAGLWVVADGLGGHRDGEVASRMVCAALADLVPSSTLVRTIGAARERLEQVNDQLHRVAVGPGAAIHSGSTVVVLLAEGRQCAVLWAGDSRLYRWRHGRLDLLTEDHSLAAEGLFAGMAAANTVTRAVGGEPMLLLDQYRDRVAPGDRFLLCSDGLTRTVRESSIRFWVQHRDLTAAVTGLMQATLDAGAPDNVTVVMVEAN